jgi:hypothetical protein
MHFAIKLARIKKEENNTLFWLCCRSLYSFSVYLFTFYVSVFVSVFCIIVWISLLSSIYFVALFEDRVKSN